MAPIRHVPTRERGQVDAVFPLSALPEPHWEYVCRPLADADHMVLHTSHTVYAWLAETPDGPPLDPSLRVRARGILPEQRWGVRFFTRDLKRVFAARPPHAVYLRLVCAGVAEQTTLFLLT
jgi:hypothetical protein